MPDAGWPGPERDEDRIPWDDDADTGEDWKGGTPVNQGDEWKGEWPEESAGPEYWLYKKLGEEPDDDTEDCA